MDDPKIAASIVVSYKYSKQSLIRELEQQDRHRCHEHLWRAA